jgi:hypothetical protein
MKGQLLPQRRRENHFFASRNTRTAFAVLCVLCVLCVSAAKGLIEGN